MLVMSITFETSHSPIGPCGLVEQWPVGDSARQRPTALLSSSFDCGENVKEAVALSISASSDAALSAAPSTVRR